MFQKAITVEPRFGGRNFMGSEDFVQEAFVGYKYGTFSKLGIVCERTPRSAYPQDQAGAAEESKEDAMDVDEDSSQQNPAANKLNRFNMQTFLEKVKKQSEKPQNAQKLLPKAIKMSMYAQMPTAHGSELYMVREDGEHWIERMRLEL